MKDAKLKIAAKNCRSIIKVGSMIFDFIVTHQIIGKVIKRILHTLSFEPVLAHVTMHMTSLQTTMRKQNKLLNEFPFLFSLFNY